MDDKIPKLHDRDNRTQYEHSRGVVRPTINDERTMRTTKHTFISAPLAAAAVIALVSMLSSAALGANPAEEMAKVGTTDPKGNSWLSIQNSIEQFGHPEFILRLFLSLGLAVGCAWVIAWHPRRSSLANP